MDKPIRKRSSRPSWLLVLGLQSFALCAAIIGAADAFAMPKPVRSISSFTGSTCWNQYNSNCNHNSAMTMRDSSASYWFRVGDTVRVTQDVYKANNINLKNRVGTVQETWEKCEVDPTCCCAEQVDTNMSVRVMFDDDGTLEHYFAEEELIKVDRE